MLACQTNATIERLDVLHRETLADTQTHRNLRRSAVHRVDIREVDHGRFVTQVLERHVLEVKMNAFQQHICRHQHFLAAEIHDSAVVSDTFLRAGLYGLEVFGKMLDQTELTHR